MACAGFCVEDVLPEDVLVLTALVVAALVAVPLLNTSATPPTPSADNAWKIEPNRPLLDDVLPFVWLVLVLVLVLPLVWLVVDWVNGLNQALLLFEMAPIVIGFPRELDSRHVTGPNELALP